MDPATLLGLIISIGAIGAGFLLEGGNFDSIFLTAPLLIVLGGTLGATTVTTSITTVCQVPEYLSIALFGKHHSFTGTINTIISMSEKARREGILGLETVLNEIKNPFFSKALKLVIDGTEITVLRDMLETEIANIEERHKRGIMFFQKAGGFAPTMGILGTVLGLIHALGNTGDASAMAGNIATAFIATLWGIGSANLFFLPISDKLRLRNEEEIAHLELIMEGMVSLQSGDNPRNIRLRLLSFVQPKFRDNEE